MSKLLNDIIEKIEPIDESLSYETQDRLDNLTKPQGSLGKLEELAKKVVCITRKRNPQIKKKVIFTFAGDHGVVEENVSAYPQEVTVQMVYNFLNEGAGINVLARHVGSNVIVADLGVSSELELKPDLVVKKINYGTKNMARTSAMTRGEAVKSIEAGIEIFNEQFSEGIDIIGTGDMGIGNTTSSSAIAAVITKKSVQEVTGRGTGINDAGLINKQQVIEKAIKLNNPNPDDPIDVLSKIGGFEIGGLSGVILAAAAERIPIVVDGFISSAAALIACGLSSNVKEYLIAAHSSVEQGHFHVLNHLGLIPLLDLNMRLGEGTGSALGISIVEASTKILNEMASFKSAGVSERID